MRVVILAGGLGTRLQEETVKRPKPMVEVGGKPILWHIMKHFAHHGQQDFVIACGYMGDFIKAYFLEQYHLAGNLFIDFKQRSIEREDVGRENWSVNLVETGLKTNTGGRLRNLRPHLHEQTFLLTYGDGVSNVDVGKLIRYHQSKGKLVTVTAVRPPARFGGLLMHDDDVLGFSEKPVSGEGWINGGFMVIEPEIFDYLDGDCSLESHILERVAADGQLAAYCHDGYWQCMDTLRDKETLNSLWDSGKAPWKTWEPETDLEPTALNTIRLAA